MSNIFNKLIRYLEKDTEKYVNFYLDSYKVNPYSEALRISIIYGLAGLLWILTSDELLTKVAGNIEVYKTFQTYKGGIYVSITTILIFYLVFIRMRVLKKTLLQLSNNYEELNSNHEELIALEEELRQQFEELELNRNALIVSEQRYELAVEGADCGIWDWDLENNIVYFSPKWKKYLGYKDKEIENTYDAWENLLHPEEKVHVSLKIKEYILAKKGSYENTYRMRCKNGEYKWILSKGNAIRNDDGKVVRIAGSHTDITEHKLLEDKLNSLAYFDKLTGLPNRFLLEEEVHKLIIKNKLSNEKFALIYMDIDNFKYINDTIGHSSGDLLLKYIANILKYHIKKPDFAARSGGDEFCIIFKNIKNKQDVSDKVQNLIKYLRRHWVLDRQEFFISYSIGIAMYPEHGGNLSTLFKRADIAMYFVKKEMKDNYSFYYSEMENKNSDHIRRVNYLRHAVDYDEVYLLYQPIIDLSDGNIAGAEALIRWTHPTLGIVPPMEFIPLAEETGLINDIEKWILKTALLQKKIWMEKKYENVKISINISGKTIINDKIIDEINNLLENTKIKSDEIQLEVTETAIMKDLDTSTRILKEIKKLGIKIALDDFGTGYSSLTYLKKLPIDVVKLDRDFIRNISKQNYDAVIVKHIIELIHDLNLKIVAEGIELKDQLSMLIDNNCDYGQGYLFSKPITKSEFEKLLVSNKRLVD